MTDLGGKMDGTMGQNSALQGMIYERQVRVDCCRLSQIKPFHSVVIAVSSLCVYVQTLIKCPLCLTNPMPNSLLPMLNPSHVLLGNGSLIPSFKTPHTHLPPPALSQNYIDHLYAI